MILRPMMTAAEATVGDAHARALGLPPDTSAREAASAFLQALPASGFLPDADMVSAVNALAGRALPSDPDAEPTSGMAEEVEEFVRAFWSLEPSVRQSTWATLLGRVGSCDSPVALRLRALERGLGVNTPALAVASETEVVAKACELFLLAPAVRAVRRNEWLLENVARFAELCHGASLVRRRSPSTVQLDPVLFNRLRPEFPASEFLSAAAAEPLPDNPGSTESTHVDYVARLTTNPAHRPAEEPAPQQRTQFPWWAATLVVIFFVRLLVSLTSSNSSSEPEPRYGPQRKIDIPKVTVPKYRTVFSAEEVERFKSFKPGPGLVPPPGYLEWKIAGQPQATPPPWW